MSNIIGLTMLLLLKAFKINIGEYWGKKYWKNVTFSILKN